MLMHAASSGLLLIDMQEKLVPTVANAEGTVKNAGILLRAAARLGLPILASEQYPKGLGHTVEPLRALLPAGAVVEKVHFSCTDTPEFNRRLSGWHRDRIVVAGVEAHICVLQTAIGLREQGYRCFVVGDASSSRAPANAALAFDRMRGNGIDVVSTEMVLFEWLHRSGTPEFKEMSPLIR
ncbi:MAG: hydrolase [Rhodospirillaceae bacterium]|nr:hydrolase [Rhodospirillaceae bacterium]